MKILFVFFLSVCIAFIGFYFGSQDKLKSEQDVIDELARSESVPTQRSLAYAIGMVTDQSTSGLNHSKTQVETKTVEEAIDHAKLDQKEIELYRVLGDDRLGLKFRRLLVAQEHRNEVFGADILVQQFLQNLKENPGQGVAEIQKILERLPHQNFPLERAALLGTMGDVLGVSAEVKTQCLVEMTQSIMPAGPEPATARTPEEYNEAMSVTPQMLLPIRAHSIFLKNTTDPAEALDGTLKGIMAQPDRRIRSTFAAKFLMKYPQMKAQLESSLSSQGIQGLLSGE